MSNATTPRQGALNVLTCSNPGGVFDPALRSPSGPERGTSAYTINPTSPNSMRRIPHTNAPEGAIPSAHRTSVASISLVSKSMASSIADTFMQQQQQQQHGGGPVHAQLKGGRSGLRQQKSSGSVGSVGSIGTIGPRGSQPNLDQLLQQNMQQQSQHNKGLQYNSAQQQSLAQLTSQQQLRLPSRVRRSSHARSDTGGHESTSKHKQSLVQLPNQGLTTSRSTGQMMGNRRKSMDVACMSQGVNIDELPAVKKESSVLSMRRSRSSTFSLWGDKKEKKNPADEFKKIEGKQRTLSVTSKDKDNNPSSGETRVVGDYILGETIGKGRYSIVKIASHRITKEKVAVKIVNKRKLSKEDLRVLKREMQVMTLLDHPNIVKLYELTDTTDHFLLILEYVAGSNLTEKVPLFATTKRKKLEPLVRKLMRQIMSAIAYCHKGHVVHRDIKPDNVMLDEDMNVKLADWGFSNISTDLLSTHCGTPYYASPELFRPHAYLGPPSDVWACGVLLYYMYVGKLPFRQDPIKEYIKKAKYQIPKSMPTTLAALIKAMLVVDPNQRLTAVDVLNSEWIQEGVPIPRSLVASGRAGMPRSTSVIFDQKSGKNSAIHDDVVALMTVHLGFTQQEVHESLQNNSYNQITATYYLLRDSPKLSQFRKFLLHTSSPAVTSEDHNSTKLFVIKESGGKNRSDGDVVKKTPQRKRSGSNRLLGFMFNRKTHTGTESPDTPSRVPDDRTDDVQFEKSFTALKGMRSGGSGMSGSIGGQQRGSNPGMHSQQSTQYLTNRRHSVQPMADVNPQDVPIRGKLGPSKSFEMGGSPQVMGMSSENIDYDDTQQQQHVEMQQQQVMLVQQQHHHQISPRSPRDFGDQVVDGNSPRGYMNGSRNLNESPRDYGSSSVSSHPRTGSHPGLNRRSSGGRIEDQLIKQQQTSSQTTYYQAMQYDAQYAAPQPVPRPDR